MHLLETVLLLLAVATFVSSVARRVGVPYPTLLAVCGAVLAFVPGAPRLDLRPNLVLALFVAPLLMDAAYDTSLRDLRRNWAPVSSLALLAVALTTAVVAIVVRGFLPGMPWAAAIALGALVAPPDAVAALAVLRHVDPPYRIRSILEGESLLNDASSLLIYRLAVAAMAAGSFSFGEVTPTIVVIFAGSAAVGWLAGQVIAPLSGRFSDAPSAVIFQFVVTFALWLGAEHLRLSGVVTVVVAGLTIGHSNAARFPARLRVPTYAIWQTVTVVLNVLAFTLIGLQLGPILAPLDLAARIRYLAGAAIILGVVIVVRFVWVLIHTAVSRGLGRDPSPLTWRGAIIVGWSGMRGIVTLAAAMAFPAGFPYRDFIQLTAFVVVMGTLVLQGLTLRPLMQLMRLPTDDLVQRELRIARETALSAAMAELDGDHSPAAERLRAQYQEALGRSRKGQNPRETADNLLRRRSVAASRRAIGDLRRRGVIGDDAYRSAEAELDLLELSAAPLEDR